jgi:hypothetical protein
MAAEVRPPLNYRWNFSKVIMSNVPVTVGQYNTFTHTLS